MSNCIRSTQFEHLFKAWNISFRHREDVVIDQIRRDDDAQVRRIDHIAIPANVDTYALQMKAGAQFPPVVVWAGMLIDGNTRLSAAKKNGLATFDVYEVELPSITMAKNLAAALNQLGGQKLTMEEARESALNYISEGFTDGQIAMYLGVTAEAARQWRKLSEVAERAERTGMGEFVAGLNKTQKMELAKVTHDQPFRDLVSAVQAAKDAGAKVEKNDLKEVVEKVVEATSDDAASQIVAEAREEWVPVGPIPSPVRKNRKAQQARMHIGGLLKAKESAKELIDPAKREEDLVRWQELQALVAEMVELLSHEVESAA